MRAPDWEGFVREMFAGSYIDGTRRNGIEGGIQDIAEKHGVLIRTPIDKPCRDDCPCAEFGGPGMECFRLPPRTDDRVVMVPVFVEMLTPGEWTKEPLFVELRCDVQAGYSITFRQVPRITATTDETQAVLDRLRRALRESEEREVEHISLNVDESDLAHLVAIVDALREDARRYRGALEPFAQFARQWERQPMRGIADEFYAIHVGTEYEASLHRSDCRRAADLLDAARVGGQP